MEKKKPSNCVKDINHYHKTERLWNHIILRGISVLCQEFYLPVSLFYFSKF